MQYLMLINLGPKARDYRNLSADEQRELAAGFQALNQTPGVTPGLGLQPPAAATTVRVQDGTAVRSEGPFVDAAQALDGYFILEAGDLDAAIDVASSVPATKLGGAVEIRPVTDWAQS